MDANNDKNNRQQIGVISPEHLIMNFNYFGGFRAILAFNERLFVIFNVFGNTVYCMDLEHNHKRKNIFENTSF